MIEKGSEKESGISMLMVRHDDDDIYIYIYIYIFKKKTKDQLIHDYKFILIPYFQFLVWTKNMKKKN